MASPPPPVRVLLTTTSFQDTPGPHHALLEDAGFEVVGARGPLGEARMLELAGSFDAFLCGDDAITRAVIAKALPRLRVISKYGIGLDKIDVAAATELRVPVLFTPGVNHTTVAEHTFALLLAALRNIVPEANAVARGEWKRITGTELWGKTLAIVGLGRIGKEVAIRGSAFGCRLIGYDVFWDDGFAGKWAVRRCASIDALLGEADVVSLHTSLNAETRHLINAGNIGKARKGAVIVNCARGELVDAAAVAGALRANHLLAYAADVLDEEPPPRDYPLLGLPNALITPHIGSRTYESVVRQATCAVENLVFFLGGRPPHARANPF